MIRVEAVRPFFVKGTIDPHDALGATFHIAGGPQGMFQVTATTVNWGRGYKPGEFRANVERVLHRVSDVKYSALFPQELDEADSAPEHKVLRQELIQAFGPGSHLVQWWTREPIILSPAIEQVQRQRKVMTMDQGSAIGAPKGTGPRRFFTSCIATIKGVRIGFGNTHPHRNLPNPKVKEARNRGERVVRQELDALTKLTDLVIWGGDMNDPNFPKMHPKEKVANERGLDTLRWIRA
jgi:hypothetical protein